MTVMFLILSIIGAAAGLLFSCAAACVTWEFWQEACWKRRSYVKRELCFSLGWLFLFLCVLAGASYGVYYFGKELCDQREQETLQEQAVQKREQDAYDAYLNSDPEAYVHVVQNQSVRHIHSALAAAAKRGYTPVSMDACLVETFVHGHKEHVNGTRILFVRKRAD